MLAECPSCGPGNALANVQVEVPALGQIRDEPGCVPEFRAHHPLPMVLRLLGDGAPRALSNSLAYLVGYLLSSSEGVLISSMKFSKRHLLLAMTLDGNEPNGPEKVSDYGPNDVPLWSPTGAKGLLSHLFGYSFQLCLSGSSTARHCHRCRCRQAERLRCCSRNRWAGCTHFARACSSQDT